MTENQSSPCDPFDFRRAPRELLEQLAAEALIWRASPPGPKPPPSILVRVIDEVCEASRKLRPRAEIDREIADLARDRAALPRPFDLDEASRIAHRIEALCREPCAESETAAAAEPAPPPCPECPALRARLVEIYHLTLTAIDSSSTVVAIREAAGPGAPGLGELAQRRARGALPREHCRACSECSDFERHHWLPDFAEFPEVGPPFIPCKHCQARAAICGECYRAPVWPRVESPVCEECAADAAVTPPAPPLVVSSREQADREFGTDSAASEFFRRQAPPAPAAAAPGAGADHA